MDVVAVLRAAFTWMLLGQWRSPAEEALVPAIYIFGDSTVDVGNNNYLPGDEVSKANFPPYGIDFPGGKPTGRFCNGYVGVDFLAIKLGFKRSPPAVLSITKSGQEDKGVNYASGGSGVLDTTGQNHSISMNEQIKYFRKTVSTLIRAKGNSKAESFLAKSVFIFSTVNNDLFAYYAASESQNTTKNEHFIDLLATEFEMQLKEIYELGARKFAIRSTGAIGCTPSSKILSPSHECDENLNRLSNMFNKVMEAKFRELRSKCEGMQYSYIHSHKIVAAVLQNHVKYGFSDINNPCCGDAAMGICNSNSTLCPNREEYLWWDSVHPTEAYYRATATVMYSGSRRVATPRNINELVHY